MTVHDGDLIEPLIVNMMQNMWFFLLNAEERRRSRRGMREVSGNGPNVGGKIAAAYETSRTYGYVFTSLLVLRAHTGVDACDTFQWTIQTA